MKKFSLDPDTAHFCWLPLIGMYTGARINEVCQLNPQSDILEYNGIHYFSFSEDTETAPAVFKSIKNKSSIRTVPIHSKLIELGILDYVNRMKSEGALILFPKWQSYKNKASALTTKWFCRYLDLI